VGVCVFKASVCLYENVPLTLKRLTIPFGTRPTRLLYFGAMVSYNGKRQPKFEPVEQRVLVVGKWTISSVLVASSLQCSELDVCMVGLFMQF